MKKAFLLVLFIVSFAGITQAQWLNGTWSSTAGGTVVIEESNNNGFQYRNTTDGSVWNTYFVSNYNGLPTYRADLQNGSYVLYMVKENTIMVSYSLNPANVYTWTKISNSAQHSRRECPVCHGKGVVFYSAGGKAVNDAFGFTRWEERTDWKVCKDCNGTGYIYK